eukprot:760140-Hanusia_phi.AAC.2
MTLKTLHTRESRFAAGSQDLLPQVVHEEQGGVNPLPRGQRHEGVVDGAAGEAQDAWNRRRHVEQGSMLPGTVSSQMANKERDRQNVSPDVPCHKGELLTHVNMHAPVSLWI